MLLSIDATFIFVFISFIIFLWLMNLICYKPITKVIEKRNEFIEKNKKTAFEANQKKEDIIKNSKEEIEKTKQESNKTLKDAKERNIKNKEAKINSKKAEIKGLINEYQNFLSENSNNVKKELKGELEFYVKSLVSKVLNVDEKEVNVDMSKADEILK